MTLNVEIGSRVIDCCKGGVAQNKYFYVSLPRSSWRCARVVIVEQYHGINEHVWNIRSLYEYDKSTIFEVLIDLI